MPINYTVQQGDCISSIAFQFGFFPDTIWQNPANADLKQLRKDPNILFAGDVVVVPDKILREECCATDASHKFVMKGVPAVFRLQVFDGTTPCASRKFRLVIDGKVFEGVTDSHGVLVVDISPDAKKGHLTIGSSVYVLDLGTIDPITEISGVQARLNNIGYDCGPPDGRPSDRLRRILRMFQSQFGLQRTGEPDDATIKKLEEIHDRVSDFPADNSPVPAGDPADDE
jgi:Putative peptidoglycan binding domain